MVARNMSRDQQERFRSQLEREAAREQAQREREELKTAKELHLQSRQDEAAEHYHHPADPQQRAAP